MRRPETRSTLTTDRRTFLCDLIFLLGDFWLRCPPQSAARTWSLDSSSKRTADKMKVGPVRATFFLPGCFASTSSQRHLPQIKAHVGNGHREKCAQQCQFDTFHDLFNALFFHRTSLVGTCAAVCAALDSQHVGQVCLQFILKWTRGSARGFCRKCDTSSCQLLNSAPFLNWHLGVGG